MMPLYEYKCARCAKVFEKLCSRDSRDQVPPCPECGCVKTKRMMSTFAGYTSGGGSIGGGGGCSSCSKGSCAGCHH